MALGLVGVLSCGGDDKEEETGNTASRPPERQAEKVTAAPAKVEPEKPPGIPPLREYRLSTVTRPIALVRIPGQQDRQGVLLRGGASERGYDMSYVMLCEVPEGTDSVTLAFSTGDGTVAVSAANRVSTLPSGLGVFGFSSKANPQVWNPQNPIAGETFHAVRIKEGAKLEDEPLAALEEELRGMQGKLVEATRKQEESRFSRRMPGPPPRGDRWEAMYDMQRQRHEHLEAARVAVEELSMLRKSERDLELRIKAGIAKLDAEEVASFPGRSEAERGGGAPDGTMLVSANGGIVAMQAKGTWLDLKKEIDSSGKLIGSAKISLNGSANDLSVTCELYPVIPSTAGNHVLIAETTHGLESVGAGSIEERLANVAPLPFQGSGNMSQSMKRMTWGGTRTRLWVKVLDPDDPGKPILDEVILLDYPGRLSARWEKEPSAIISIPPAKPNTPEDLEAGRSSLDAKGEILDIVAAGDGSVVMVRTASEPFWAPLDLKSGKWLSVPWKASANTLLATQAGKVYLLDRESMVVEVWGLESGKREGLHVLQLQDTAIALAAPLSDTGQPVMLATAKGLHFLDPKDFEPVSCGMDGGDLFPDPANTNSRRQPLDAATISLRASDDGVLYSISGKRIGSQSRGMESTILTMDRSPLVVRKNSEQKLMATKGRELASELPDHAGSGVKAVPQPYAARFPETTGEIRFSRAGANGEIAVLNNPPVLPDITGNTPTAIAADRSAYLDSAAGVMLLPDGATLHILRLKLPELAPADPTFLLSGEAFGIPLPPGNGHKLTSREGVQGEITATHARWIAPESSSESVHQLKLEWTGELGSAISEDFQVRVITAAPQTTVESPDGSLSFPLRRRGIIANMPHDVKSFAGSGFVALTDQSGLGAWNLASCERIFTSTELRARSFFGDADHLYVFDHEGKLTSFDIPTGNMITQTVIGREVSGIGTGMSSRDGLLAIESTGFQGYLLQISRDTLKSEIVDLPEGLRKKLFNRGMTVNASGSAAWTGGTGVFRDGRAITVTPYQGNLGRMEFEGTPDLFGRQVINGKTILKLSEKSIESLDVPGLPGLGDRTGYSLDASGLYLLLRDNDRNSKTQVLSVRDVRSPEKELFKIRYPGSPHGSAPMVIAESKTLLTWQYLSGANCAFVHDLDVPEIIRQLAN